MQFYDFIRFIGCLIVLLLFFLSPFIIMYFRWRIRLYIKKKEFDYIIAKKDK